MIKCSPAAASLVLLLLIVIAVMSRNGCTEPAKAKADAASAAQQQQHQHPTQQQQQQQVSNVGHNRDPIPQQQLDIHGCPVVRFLVRNGAAVQRHLTAGAAPAPPVTVVCVVGTASVLPQVLTVFAANAVVVLLDLSPDPTTTTRTNHSGTLLAAPPGSTVPVYHYSGAPPEASIRQFAQEHPGSKCHVALLTDVPVADPDMLVRLLHTQSSHVATGERHVVLAADAWLRKTSRRYQAGGGGGAAAAPSVAPPLLHDQPLSMLRPVDLATPAGAAAAAPLVAQDGVVVCRFDHTMPFPNPRLAEIVEKAPWQRLELAPFNIIKRVLEQQIKPKARDRVEGNSGQLHMERQIYATIAAMPEIQTICEIGFNAGHSASLWLKANPTASVYMFDLFEHPYGRMNEASIRGRGGIAMGLANVNQRLHTFQGSSLQSVPQFIASFPHVKCNLVSVDGGHWGDVPYVDLINMRRLTNQSFHVVVIDDTNCESRYCTAVNDAIVQHGANLSVLLRVAEHRLGVGAFQRGVTVLQYAKTFLES